MLFHRTSEFASSSIGHPNDRPASPLASGGESTAELSVPRSGHPKMLPAQPGINATRALRIDINALDEADPVHFTRHIRKLTDEQFDDGQFSEEQGDGPIY